MQYGLSIRILHARLAFSKPVAVGFAGKDEEISDGMIREGKPRICSESNA